MQHLAYIPTITNYTKLWWIPNVIVAHQKEGIEAVHLASGRTLCKVNIGAAKHTVLQFASHNTSYKIMDEITIFFFFWVHIGFFPRVLI